MNLKLVIKTLLLVACAAMAMAAPVTFADTNPFAVAESSGEAMQVAGAEGKCGEGKCGEGKAKAEGKCGEGKCGEGKCGEGCLQFEVQNEFPRP